MGIFLQPGCSLALQLKYEAATDHLGMFSGLDSILPQSFENPDERDEGSLRRYNSSYNVI